MCAGEDRVVARFIIMRASDGAMDGVYRDRVDAETMLDYWRDQSPRSEQLLLQVIASAGPPGESLIPDCASMAKEDDG